MTGLATRIVFAQLNQYSKTIQRLDIIIPASNAIALIA